MSVNRDGPIAWVVESAEPSATGLQCDGVYSSLDRAMMAAHDQLLSPKELLAANKPDRAVYGWADCEWRPVPIDDNPNISMVMFELWTCDEPIHLVARVRAYRVDEFLPDWAIYE